jgi:hypothetical protein
MRLAGRGNWILGFLAVCLAAGLPSDLGAQIQKGAVLLDGGVGLQRREFSDYSEDVFSLEANPKVLVTDWLALGAGWRVGIVRSRAIHSVYASLVCLVNTNPGVKRLVPHVGLGAGTAGSEGTGQMWFATLGASYSISRSVGVSASAIYERNFRHRSHRTEYFSFGGLLRVSLQFGSAG